MKTRWNILLFCALLVLSFVVCPSASQEQVVTATARVTLTIIPRPGIGFTLPDLVGTSPSANQIIEGGITLKVSNGVPVILKFLDHGKTLETYHFGLGETKTFTSKELGGVSKVEITYLGS